MIQGLPSSSRPSPIPVRPKNLQFGRKAPEPVIMRYDLEGEITSEKAKKLLNDFQHVLKQGPDRYPAVLLRINSPGGATGSSEELREGIQKLRQNGIKVVASMGDMAASGGLLVASAADRVIAPAGAITGSIGVIISLRSMKGLYEKLGFKEKEIYAGNVKNITDLDELMAEAPNGPRHRVWNDLLNSAHDQFIRQVVEGRNSAESEAGQALTEESLRKIADGRPLTGAQAYELGLVDHLGGILEAAEQTRALIDMPNAKIFALKDSKLKSPWRRLMARLKTPLSGSQTISLESKLHV